MTLTCSKTVQVKIKFFKGKSCILQKNANKITPNCFSCSVFLLMLTNFKVEFSFY